MSENQNQNRNLPIIKFEKGRVSYSFFPIDFGIIGIDQQSQKQFAVQIKDIKEIFTTIGKSFTEHANTVLNELTNKENKEEFLNITIIVEKGFNEYQTPEIEPEALQLSVSQLRELFNAVSSGNVNMGAYPTPRGMPPFRSDNEVNSFIKKFMVPSTYVVDKGQNKGEHSRGFNKPIVTDTKNKNQNPQNNKKEEDADPISIE
jgi:hypothetical protein